MLDEQWTLHIVILDSGPRVILELCQTSLLNGCSVIQDENSILWFQEMDGVGGDDNQLILEISTQSIVHLDALIDVELLEELIKKKDVAVVIDGSGQ